MDIAPYRRIRAPVTVMRVRRLARLTVLALAASLVTGAVVGSPAASAGRTHKPDIVLIVTDDQRAETLAAMPQVQRLLVRRGVSFTQAMVPTAMCCPSRSTILTGLYSHSTRVFTNGIRHGGVKYGGWPKFHQRGLEQRTIAVALDGAGYRTGLFGKYLNRFGDFAPRGYRPPGWDRFVAFRTPNAAYYNYRLTDGRRFGAAAQDYSTDVLADSATDFLRSTPRGRPAFVMYTPFAPHEPFAAAPRHADVDVTVPPTFAERPAAGSLLPAPGLVPRPPLLSSAPAWVLGRHDVARARVGRAPAAQVRSLLAVDEAVARLVQVQRERRRLHRTLFVFMSDNGFLWGEHGLAGKDSAYSGAIRVPLVLRWDGRVAPGTTDDRLALNVDIARTLSHAAGVSMPTEGLDLLGDRRRDGFPVEAAQGNWGRPPYCGWRTRDWLYVRYANGREELFDYRSDPAERHNLADVSAAAAQRASMRAAAERACSPVPPGFRW